MTFKSIITRLIAVGKFLKSFTNFKSFSRFISEFYF